ncbi:MAG: hypothetical protein ACYS30_23940, partial [Planctomycetota bacterium]
MRVVLMACQIRNRAAETDVLPDLTQDRPGSGPRRPKAPNLAGVSRCSIGLDLIDLPVVSGLRLEGPGMIGGRFLVADERRRTAGTEIHIVRGGGRPRQPAKRCIQGRNEGIISRVGLRSVAGRRRKAPDI